MITKRKLRRGVFGGRVAITVLTLLGTLIFAQLISAAQGGEMPTPTAGSSTDTIAPTDAELLAMPPTIDRYLAAHTLPNGAIAAANLDNSNKTASNSSVSPGRMFEYTINIVNSGGLSIPVTMTDELPVQLNYISHQCPLLVTTSCGYSAGTVTWQGTAAAGESVAVTIVVMMKNDVERGTTVTNTARLVSVEQELEVSAEVTVTEYKASPIQFMPFLVNGPFPGPIALTAGQPNSSNTWDLSWTAGNQATGYEIQESNDPEFTAPTSLVVGPVTNYAVTKLPSPDNVYYYRARTLVGEVSGPWSNTVSVVGGYRDDFDDPSTGWAVRRGTHKDDVKGFYENGRYVTSVTSRWDWLIASPLRPAPRVPYVIDFEARIISQSYVHSAGAVFGGDWNGGACPPDVGGDPWAQHENCFNHFYNTNSIYNNTNASNVKIRLLFERVDQLEWRPNDGGSPLKRVGNIITARDFRYIDPKGWNHYRIEVRADSIRIYAAKAGEEPQFQYEYTDTRWVSSPYFGFFTSTDIIENSTWRFEYMQVMPLDQ